MEKVGCDQDLRDHMSSGSLGDTAPIPMSRQHCPELEEQTQLDGWPDPAPGLVDFKAVASLSSSWREQSPGNVLFWLKLCDINTYFCLLGHLCFS